MSNHQLIEIRINKVVPAEKWRVIRLLTRVWEFSEHVPTIAEVTVLEKSRHTVKTKWSLLVDDIPIQWIEEDTLDLRKNTIRFRAIEGDLETFGGAWQFEDHPGGTKVSVTIRLSVGIPAIKDFADEYIRKLVAKNFNAILEALEHRLISVRYARVKAGYTDKVAGFGVLGHFYNFNHMERSLKTLNPDFKMPSREFMTGLFRITPSFKRS